MDACRDVTLSEMLADPLVRMVMDADGVDPQELETNLRAAARGGGSPEPG
jgi:hypothetical protein